MLEASLDKLPEHYCWSYFMPFFWLILLFAVVTEFVTFGVWNVLQYLSNITSFCCHTSGNFHQSCKILVLMKECDVNEQLIKYRMNSPSFSSLYSPCRDCDQISKDVLKSMSPVTLENQINCSPWRGWTYMSSGACSAPQTELPWTQALPWLCLCYFSAWAPCWAADSKHPLIPKLCIHRCCL